NGMYCITSYIIYTSTAFFLIHSNIRCLIVSNRKGKSSTHIFYFPYFIVCNHFSNTIMLWMKGILELPATYRPYGLIEVGDSWEQSVLYYGGIHHSQRFLLFTKLP